MPTFEQGFASVEAAAETAESAAKALAATARKLRRAAQDGTLSKVRQETGQLAEDLLAASETVRHATSSWPFAESQESAYLSERYSDELHRAAAAVGLSLTSHDDALVCSPSIIRLLPADRSLRIDGKKRGAIRPSRLAADLQAVQQRMRPKTDAQHQRFLEALYRAFRVIRGKTSDPSVDATRVVALAEIYAVFTSLPGTNKQYTKTDFARDIYLLDSSSVTTTKAGARVSFTGSVRRSSGIFSFVDRNGNVIRYYGVRFAD